MNLFVAIFPGSDVYISERVSRGRDRFPKADYRYIASEKRHVTVLFLGDHDENDCQRARLIFSSLPGGLLEGSPPEIVFDRIGPFPPGRRSRVVALYGGSDPPSDLLEIRRLLMAGFATLRPDSRAFRPHLTVAYPRRGTRLRDVAPISIEPVRLVVREIALVATRNRENGSFYDVLARCHAKCVGFNR